MSELLSHAWLLWGEGMELLREEAMEMMISLVGEQIPNIRRRIHNNSFSDCIYIGAQSGKILIDDVRMVQRYLGMAANEGIMRFAVFENAHNMTNQAQNAMLKMLEETPDNRIIFLLAQNTDNILPTVLSRVQSRRFRESREDTSNSHTDELCSLLEGILLRGEIEAIFRAADYIIGDKLLAPGLLLELYGIFSDIYKYRLKVADLPPRLEYLGQNISAKCAASSMERVNEALGDLASNASALLAIQAMLADIREEYYAENRRNQI